MAELRDAEIIIIGGGIVGCSIAYHLTRMGRSDVLVVEKSGLTHGATWHAAGLVGQLRGSRNLTRLLQKSVALYDRLEAETGQAIDWKKVGSLRVAGNDERMLEIKRMATMAKSFGLEMSIVSPSEARDMFPLMDVDDIEGAAFIPSDGHVDPSSVTQALAKGARDKGAAIVQGVRVTDMTLKDRRVEGIVTDHGTARCDIVVNSAGFWGRELGLMAGVAIPTIALEHQYLVTEPIPGMPADMPTMRDPDLLVYYKPEVNGLAIGGWEHDTVPFGEAGIPKDFAQQLLPDKFERFEQLALNAAKRTPVVNQVGVRQLINGPIPWSADGEFVLGWVKELDNYFAATGFTIGIAAAGGAGQMIAEWIVEGAPSLDLWTQDVRRFSPHHNTPEFLYARTIESYAKYYHVHYPGEEADSARPIHTSPLYETLKDQGAVHGSKAGWERPNWFAPQGVEPVEKPSFKHPNWFEHVGAEHRAVRERAALIDQASFSKMEIAGPGALAALQRLAVSNMDRPAGRIIYTQLCNERGGIEADLTISRVADDAFYLVTGSAFGVHDRHWIERNIPSDGSVTIKDVSREICVINLCGPEARKVLEKVTGDDVSNAVFPFATFKDIRIAAAPVRAQRIGYVGELGWELHIPFEHGLEVYQALWRAGEAFGVANVGYRAIDSLRMEKGYLYWSADITPDYNPFEAGLDFRVNFDKGDFIGRDALLKARDDGVERKLCIFTLDKTVPVFGGEAIGRQGQVLDVVTSANFGYTIGKPIVMGYLPAGEAAHTDFEVEAFGETIPATRHDGPLYDAKMERLKS